jgi:hypothetical protein
MGGDVIFTPPVFALDGESLMKYTGGGDKNDDYRVRG